jgi:segregation and condensation protein A
VTDAADSPTEAHLAGPTGFASEDPPRADATDRAPRLAVAGFDEPLEMARAHQIDLASLSIAALIEAFSATLQAALGDRAGARLEHWAAWTVTAATLTELWSRLMLPAGSPEAKGAAAEALRAQMASRARMQAGADWLDRRAQLGQDLFRRGQPEAAASVHDGDLTELSRACLVVLKVPAEQVVVPRPRPPPFWTTGEAMRQIAKLLPGLPDPAPLAAFLPKIDRDAPTRALRCRVAAATTLVAGLELARNGGVALDQDAGWMSIRVTRRETGGGSHSIMR